MQAYGNEIILMVKAASLASLVTIMEISGLAYKLISENFRAFEVFFAAAAIYLLINFIVTQLVRLVERRVIPDLETRSPAAVAH